jgi:DNA repair protein RadC
MKPIIAKEWKVVCLREQPVPADMLRCDTPDKAVEYWRECVISNPAFNSDVETLVVLILNTRRRCVGHVIVSTGTLDTILVHPREVFRPALVANASALILMHNHPSGESAPSEADVKVTRELIRAGQILRVEVLDHIVVGRDEFKSLRELGYFYTA